MKRVYLVHIYRNGIYHHTCNLAFTSKSAAERYIADCGAYGEAQQVELLSMKDF